MIVEIFDSGLLKDCTVMDRSRWPLIFLSCSEFQLFIKKKKGLQIQELSGQRDEINDSTGRHSIDSGDPSPENTANQYLSLGFAIKVRGG